MVGIGCALALPADAQTRSLGLDISAHQGDISQATWNNFANVENRDFVIIRSSRGGTTGFDKRQGGHPLSDNDDFQLSQRYDDKYFVQNITRATAAGMFAGTYHRSRADVIASTPNFGGGTAGVDNNGTDEANHFIQMAGPWMRPGYLPPMLDFEDGELQRNDQQMAQFALDFGNRIYDVMGIRPGIYVNGNYAHNILAGGTTAQRSQLADQTSNPPGLSSSPTFPMLWSARWPAGSGQQYFGDVQNEQANDTFTNLYGPWDDYGVSQPWAIWQYASGGRLQSFNNGNSNLDFNVANGGIEFLKDHLVPAVWMNDNSGDWSTLANWNSGQTPIAPVVSAGQMARVGPLTMPTPRLPGAAGSGVTSGQNDTVILERPNADITVTLSEGSHNIRKLYARETLNITGGALTINYVPTSESTSLSAQFSADVALENADLSVHTLQVDATRTFTTGDAALTLTRINLMPHAVNPAKLLLDGDMFLDPLGAAAAIIANGAGAGGTGFIDLGGANRVLHVGDGAAATDLTLSVPLLNGGLTKDGPGTLHLTASNVYEGDTSVEEGTLRINSAFLSDAADVYLSSESLLDLNFGGSPDLVDSLFIDGVAQPGGTWGAPDSGAQNTTPWITGTGLLRVAIPGDFDGDGFVDGTDLVQWQGDYGDDGGSDADGDGDTDGRDFFIWQQNYTGPGPLTAPATAIPEPAALSLLLLSLVVASGMRRKS